MKVKILRILLLTILIIALYNVTSNAAISATSSTVNSGENVSISISSNIPVLSYAVTVTNNGGLTLVNSSGGTGEGTSTITNASSSGMTNLATFTFRVPTVSTDSTYSVRFNATIMEDEEFNSIPDSSATATITVKAPSTPPSTDPEPPSEPNFTSVNETVYIDGNNVRFRESYSLESRILYTFSNGQMLTRTGIGNEWSRVSFNGQTGYIYSQYLTTTAPAVDNEDDEEEDDPVKSSNNYLKSLTVNNGTLSPNFNPRTTSYTVVVEDDLEEITISAETEDEKATVSGSGTIQLEEGNTTARIEVVAENGSTNTYTIHIRKESAEEIITVGIKSLKIQGVTADNKTEDISFMPDFKTDVTEYTCNISDQITKLLITAEPNEENMTIEILGNENLQMGENVITILVKSEDGQEIYTYQIIVTKGEVAPTSRYWII